MADSVAEGQIPHGGSDQAESRGTHRRSDSNPLHVRGLEGEPVPADRPTAASPPGLAVGPAGTVDPPDPGSGIPPSRQVRENTRLTVLVRRWIAAVANNPVDMSAEADPGTTQATGNMPDPSGSARSWAGLPGWEGSSTPPSSSDRAAPADGAVASARPSNTACQRGEDGKCTMTSATGSPC